MTKTDELRPLVDLDARRAQRAEANPQNTTVRLGGETFDFPPMTEWPVELVDVLSRGELANALRLLLSDDDAERFFAQRPTMGDLNDLFDALGKRAGVGGLGNSGASASS